LVLRRDAERYRGEICSAMVVRLNLSHKTLRHNFLLYLCGICKRQEFAAVPQGFMFFRRDNQILRFMGRFH